MEAQTGTGEGGQNQCLTGREEIQSGFIESWNVQLYAGALRVCENG